MRVAKQAKKELKQLAKAHNMTLTEWLLHRGLMDGDANE